MKCVKFFVLLAVGFLFLGCGEARIDRPENQITGKLVTPEEILNRVTQDKSWQYQVVEKQVMGTNENYDMIVRLVKLVPIQGPPNLVYNLLYFKVQAGDLIEEKIIDQSSSCMGYGTSIEIARIMNDKQVIYQKRKFVGHGNGSSYEISTLSWRGDSKELSRLVSLGIAMDIQSTENGTRFVFQQGTIVELYNSKMNIETDTEGEAFCEWRLDDFQVSSGYQKHRLYVSRNGIDWLPTDIRAVIGLPMTYLPSYKVKAIATSQSYILSTTIGVALLELENGELVSKELLRYQEAGGSCDIMVNGNEYYVIRYAEDINNRGSVHHLKMEVIKYDATANLATLAKPRGGVPFRNIAGNNKRIEVTKKGLKFELEDCNVEIEIE